MSTDTEDATFVPAALTCAACAVEFVAMLVAAVRPAAVLLVERLCHDRLNRLACPGCGHLPDLPAAPTYYLDDQRRHTVLVGTAPAPAAYVAVIRALPPERREALTLADGAMLRAFLDDARRAGEAADLINQLASSAGEGQQLLEDNRGLINDWLFAWMGRQVALTGRVPPEVYGLVAGLLDHVRLLDDPEPFASHERTLVERCSAILLGRELPPWYQPTRPPAAHELVEFADRVAAGVPSFNRLAALFAISHLSVALASVPRMAADAERPWQPAMVEAAVRGAIARALAQVPDRSFEASGYARLAARALDAVAAADPRGIDVRALERRIIEVTLLALRIQARAELAA